MNESEITYWNALAARLGNEDIKGFASFNANMTFLLKPFRHKINSMPESVKETILKCIGKMLELKDFSSPAAQACLVDAYFFTRTVRHGLYNKKIYDLVNDKKLLQISR